ncbi:hypothetical protein DL93DRAFT_814169 [Clavulina sp. PMI_390]|nr:hypothetical protein DL93DRAFT_814169 [Clavulina sp. PMI_390]
MENAKITAIIPDVLLEIISHLSVKDILRLRRTCRTFYELTSSHAVWHTVIHRQLLPSGLTLPIRKELDPSLLSASELKAISTYASRLEHSWRNPNWARLGFASIEWEPEMVNRSVPMAFIIPGMAGRYLLTITRNCLVRIWELEPGVRRKNLKHEWTIDGVMLDVAFNSDPNNQATFAVSSVIDREEYVTLYNLSFGTEISHSVIWVGELYGRFKILRGDLVVSYRPSRRRVYIGNYRTGAVAWLDHGPSIPMSIQPGVTCHSVELCHGCVVVSQLWGIDVFELPEGVVSPIAEPQRDARNQVIPVMGRLLGSIPRDPTARWESSSIIPYCAPYPNPGSQYARHGAQRKVSVLIRMRVRNEINTQDESVIHHVLLLLPPDLSSKVLALAPPPPPPVDAPRRDTDPPNPADPVGLIQFLGVQTKSGIRPHYFHDMVVSPSSGRGFWLENVTVAADRQSNEKLMLFSKSPRVTGTTPSVKAHVLPSPTYFPESIHLKGDDFFPLLDLGGSDDWARMPRRFRPFWLNEAHASSRLVAPSSTKDSAREGTVQWCLPNMPYLIRGASLCSFDDSVGRIVISTHDGKVRVIDLGSARS